MSYCHTWTFCFAVLSLCNCSFKPKCYECSLLHDSQICLSICSQWISSLQTSITSLNGDSSGAETQYHTHSKQEPPSTPARDSSTTSWIWRHQRANVPPAVTQAQCLFYSSGRDWIRSVSSVPCYVAYLCSVLHGRVCICLLRTKRQCSFMHSPCCVASLLGKCWGEEGMTGCP